MISSAEPQFQELVELPAPLELAATLWPLAHGAGDPTIRFAADGVWRVQNEAGEELLQSQRARIFAGVFVHFGQHQGDRHDAGFAVALQHQL